MITRSIRFSQVSPTARQPTRAVLQVLFGTSWLVALTAISIRAGQMATGSKVEGTRPPVIQEQASPDGYEADSTALPDPDTAAGKQANGSTTGLGSADQATQEALHEALQILARSVATGPDHVVAQSLAADTEKLSKEDAELAEKVLLDSLKELARQQAGTKPDSA